MSEDLKEVISHLNLGSKGADTSDPVAQIAKVKGNSINMGIKDNIWFFFQNDIWIVIASYYVVNASFYASFYASLIWIWNRNYGFISSINFIKSFTKYFLSWNRKIGMTKRLSLFIYHVY